MYSKEEKKEMKLSFWTELNDQLTEAGKAKGRNLEWMNYPTQIKRLFFRMEADEHSAKMCIDMQFVTKGIREIYFLQFQEFENKLKEVFTEEVIFNGTQKKKPLGFCEVTLTIENNKNLLPIEYDTVEITRRYYRSGESEYYINKTQCRLKDIHDMLIDTEFHCCLT